MQILYEDNHLLIAVKPQNMPTQADCTGDEDLLTALKAYIKETYQKPGAVYLGLVHRLDRPSGGVMAFARTSKAASRLSAQLKTREMSRKYYAVVHGSTPDAGVLEDSLLKNEKTNIVSCVKEGTSGAKRARLTFRTIAREAGCSLVEAHLETGRSHQIRVQFAHAGHPLIHDQKYDPNAERGNLALWAHELTLTHPTKKTRMTFSCAPPDESVWKLFDLEDEPPVTEEQGRTE